MKNWALEIAMVLCVVAIVVGTWIAHKRDLTELRENDKPYWKCELCVLPENSREPIYTNGCTRIREKHP